MTRKEAKEIERQWIDSSLGSFDGISTDEQFEDAMNSLKRKLEFIESIMDLDNERESLSVLRYEASLGLKRVIHYFEQQEITKIDQQLLQNAI